MDVAAAGERAEVVRLRDGESMVSIKKAFQELFSTFTEIHYFAVGFAAGFVLGWVLGCLFALAVS